MCGIVGYKGDKNAQDILTNGLSCLEYRGYDSSGIAYFIDNKIKIVKALGQIKNLKNQINYKDQSNLGIGHTRWATHGKVNLDNCHPHQVGKITLVHNGIIENYGEIKKELQKSGYDFYGETDTEVACALIDYNYKKTNNMLKAIKKSIDTFMGSYAFLILCSDESDKLYATRNNSPLIVANKNDEFFLASDVPAILKYTNKYYLLNNKDIIEINQKINFYDENLQPINKKECEYDLEASNTSKGEYEHFMLKEINEIDEVIKKTVAPFIISEKELKSKFKFLDDFEKIEIVACGSAYHAGLIGKYLIEKYSDIKIDIDIASEYRYKKHNFNVKTLVIIISQSGETADSLAALKIAKENGAKTLGIVNVYESSIARESDEVIYTKAGPEIAVATTKAYVSQVAIFSLMTMYFKAKNDAISKDIQDMKILPQKVKEILNQDFSKLASIIYKENNVFFLGRQIDYALCMEGSLKLKEISYIHSEAYAAGELKHGSIALIDKDTPVIAINTDDDILPKTISNIKEVKARGAYVIYLTNTQPENNDFYDKLIKITKLSPLVEPILAIIPLQLLSYHVAKLRGCSIDKPKNLAKSVTVE